MFSLLMFVASDWFTRALVGLIAMLPAMAAALPTGLWRRLRGPARSSFTRLHWVVFCAPTAALLILAAVALVTGRSLS
jgi:hypothetical protein